MSKRNNILAIGVLLYYIHMCNCSSMFDNNPLHTPEIYSGKYHELAVALNQENSQQIDLLVKRNHLNLNYADDVHHLSLLNWCIFNKKFISFEKLLELEADPNWLDSNEAFPQPIIEASQEIGNYLKEALRFKGNSNCYFPKAQWFADCTPLDGAIYSGDINNVKLLVDIGADINFSPKSFANPLLNALIQDKIEIAEYLLIKGADVNKVSLIIEGKDTVGILYLLRKMTFPLNSKEHKIKMNVVKILASRGLDYWKYPIPEDIQKSFKNDLEFLSKY